MQQSGLDHGIPVNAVESRTGAVCIREDGESRIVLAAKGFVLIVDPQTERCTQVRFPNFNDGYPFMSYSSKAGMFYTGANEYFMELDPFKERFITSEVIGESGEIAGFSFAENVEGELYFSCYPKCKLFKYNPITKKMNFIGRWDEEQQYPSYLAVDSAGWVYAGIGSSAKKVMAYDPYQSHELTPFDLRVTK